MGTYQGQRNLGSALLVVLSICQKSYHHNTIEAVGAVVASVLPALMEEERDFVSQFDGL